MVFDSAIFEGKRRAMPKKIVRRVMIATAITVAGCGGNGSNESSSNSSLTSDSSSVSMSSSSSSQPTNSSSSGLTADNWVYAVNSGGVDTTVDGILYSSDRFFKGGSISSTEDSIGGASSGDLYQSERYGSYLYEVPVSDSYYGVQLHFAEIYHEQAGNRLFNVTIEGEAAVTNFDLYDEAGHDTAYSVTVNDVAVSDGFLTIELESLVDNATLSGFAIYSDHGGQYIPPVEPEGCDLPDRISWTSTGEIISARGSDRAVKDPSIVYYNGKYHVFATTNDGNWRSMYTSFSDFSEAPNAGYQRFSPGGSSTVAPQVFYFTPQNRWYIFTQWPAKYTSTSNIEDPSSWASPTTLFPGNDDHGGALDYWVICNDSSCYLYFFKDDGNMYYVSTSLGNFPNFNVNQVRIANVEGSGGQSILFEAGNVYKIKGSDKYLLQVEGWGSSEGRRLYRSWTSTSLDGPWQAHKTTESDPFAGLNNVSFPGGRWSQQISHGEMIRDGYDEKMILDTCNMQFFYQGVDLSNYSGDYGGRPYGLGLLTAEQ